MHLPREPQRLVAVGDIDGDDFGEGQQPRKLLTKGTRVDIGRNQNELVDERLRCRIAFHAQQSLHDAPRPETVSEHLQIAAPQPPHQSVR